MKGEILALAMCLVIKMLAPSGIEFIIIFLVSTNN